MSGISKRNKARAVCQAPWRSKVNFFIRSDQRVSTTASIPAWNKPQVFLQIFTCIFTFKVWAWWWPAAFDLSVTSGTPSDSLILIRTSRTHKTSSTNLDLNYLHGKSCSDIIWSLYLTDIFLLHTPCFKNKVLALASLHYGNQLSRFFLGR